MGRLADAAKNLHAQQQGPLCAVGKILQGEDRELAEDLTDLLASKMSRADVARALNDIGIDISDHTVQRHERRDCRCGKAR